MNVINRVAHLFSKNGNGAEQKAAGVPPILGPGVAMFWDLTPGPATAQSNLTARLAYKRDNLVWSCMQFRANKLTEPPLWIAEEGEDGEEWLTGAHPLEQILEEPNPDQDMAEFLAVVSNLVDIDGECLIVKVRDGGKRVAQLWPYNKDLYQVEPANGRLYGRFRINKQSGYEDVAPEDVIFLTEANPTALNESVSRVRTALTKINLSQDLVETIRQILRRGVNPGGIFTFKNELTPEQKEAIRSEIQQKLAGVHNAGGAMILTGDNKYEHPVVSLKDMTTGPAQFDCEAAICQAFQIHPLLVGAKVGIEANTGLADSIEPALRLFYDIAARPRWRWLERKLTKGLLREVDPNPRRFIRFDTSKVQALQEGMLERVQTAAAAAQFWTVNECRVYTEQEPLEDERGDMLVTEAAAPRIDPLALIGGGQPDDEKARKRTRSSTDAASRHILYLSRRAVQEAHEFTIETAARAQLHEDMEHIAAIVRGSTKADPVGPLPDPDAITAKVDSYLKKSARDRWDDRMRPPMEALGRHSVQQMAAELRVGFNVLERGILKFIDKEVGFLIRSVTETTRDNIRRELRLGMEAGESVSQLAERIAQSAGFSHERAKLIARTESTRATNGAQRESLSDYAKTSGNKAKKEWLATLDDRVREEHEAMNGETKDINEPFSNGLQAPGEPNCRCTLLYSIEEA